MQNGFTLDDDTPRSERIYMGQGGKLPGKPNRKELTGACRKGSRLDGGRIVKCPSRRGPGRKQWTTADAYAWYLEEMNRDG